jgi:hypothetical protein
MSYLSDLVPTRVEETPFFNRRTPYRRDQNLAGGPIKVDGVTHEKGLSVHARSDLTFDLERRFTTFETLLGFDDEARKKGRVDVKVFADGKEIFARNDLRGDAPPVRLSLPVGGAEQLRLVVDFGPNDDAGDRVIWADAKLYRVAPPAAGPGAVEIKQTAAATPPRAPSGP